MHRVAAFRTTTLFVFTFLGMQSASLCQVDWNTLERQNHAMAPFRDGNTHTIVLFGGARTTDTNRLKDTWRFDSGVWLPQPTPDATPPELSGHAMALFDLTNVLLLFGGAAGRDNKNKVNDTTFKYLDPGWGPSSGKNPPGRMHHGMVYASTRSNERILLFGGMTPGTSGNVFQDTWEWKDAWTEVSVQGTRPAPRYHHAMAFARNTDRTVVFGGNGFIAETWEFDLLRRTWVQYTKDPKPDGREEAAMAYDRNGKVVLFGGRTKTGAVNDTWLWDSVTKTWTEAKPPNKPEPRSGHTMVYDAASSKIIVMGGANAAGKPLFDTWEWNGTTWTRLLKTPFDKIDDPRKGHALVYDAARKEVILFGGSTARLGVIGEMWIWDGGRWSQKTFGKLDPKPSARSSPSMAYDSGRKRVVLFGGVGEDGTGNRSAILDDTWEWDGTKWTKRNITGPPRREGAGMAYDSARGVIVLHGGLDNTDPNNVRVYDTTYEFDGTRWTEKSPPKKPGSRPPERYAGFGMAYDEVRRVVVLFGGFDRRTYPNPKPYGDTWLWNGSAWTDRTPSTSPSARGSVAMAYDSARDRIVLFGGNTGNSTAVDDTWEWTGTSWIDRTKDVVTSPPKREVHAIAYDAARKQIVMFGGKYEKPNRVVFADTWFYGPIDPADTKSIGPGCGGSAGTPALDAAPGKGPWIDATLVLQTTNLPPSQPGLFILARSAIPALDLAFLQLPGCKLRVRLDILLAFPTGTGTFSLSVPMPNDPNLLGSSLFAQCFALDPRPTGGGGVVSNGLELLFGAK